MAVTKTSLLVIGSGTLAAGETSTCHGIDVSTYVNVGVDIQISTVATDGTVYVKIYGLNSSDYDGDKFSIVTYAMPATERYQHFSIPTMDFLNLCVTIVNSTGESVDYTISVVGVKVT